MKNLKNEKGITLVSLIMYIILTAIILAILSVISISFRNNLSNMNTDTMQDTEFDKLNIQLLKETKIEDNYIDAANSEDTKIVFTNGNTYTYVESDKAIYLNNYIKVAENIESCTYEYSEVNDKLKLTVTVKINGLQRILEYTFIKDLSEEYSVWDGESSEPPVLIDANWYIYNAKQFKFFADYVNSGGVLTEEQENQVIKAGYNPESLTISDSTTVYLMRNLDLGARTGEDKEWGTRDDIKVEWTPIGTTNAKKFIGTFEGNNHIIKGVYVSVTGNFAGIFGNSNTIQNITISNSYIKATGGAVGGIVGALRNGSLINCHNINTQVIGGADIIGGIAGQFTGSRITKCSNSGNIYSMGTNDSSCVGGIVGVSQGSIESCSNLGTISGTGARCGGIVGEKQNETEIIECINKSLVNGTSEIGGIAGVLFGDIEKCYNEGAITGTGNNIGGICGRIGDKTITTIKNTYNKGNVKAGGNYIGGIVGNVISTATTVNINNNYNTGQVSTEASNGTNIGGTIGYIATTNTIKAERNYYLSGVVTEKGSYTSGTSKTDTEMKSNNFVTELNTGLSVKAWKKTSTYPELIGM